MSDTYVTILVLKKMNKKSKKVYLVNASINIYQMLMLIQVALRSLQCYKANDTAPFTVNLGMYFMLACCFFFSCFFFFFFACIKT